MKRGKKEWAREKVSCTLEQDLNILYIMFPAGKAPQLLSLWRYGKAFSLLEDMRLCCLLSEERQKL